MEVFDDDASAYKLDADIKAQEYPMQNLTIYISVNTLMVVLQLLGGYMEYKFCANLFFGITLILGFVCTAVVMLIDNKTFAKTHVIGWWSFYPLFIGLVSFGFGWYFTGLEWWAIGGLMISKKIIGESELDNEVVVETGAGPLPVPPQEV